MIKGTKKINTDNKSKTRKTTKKVITDVSDKILNFAIEGIKEKKGHDIVYMDLKKLNSSICDYFVICHGTSSTQVLAIAESIEKQVKINTGLNPSWREGVANAEWILLDYVDVVVHVFKEEVREFYQLETLWADAPSTKLEDES
ncbi:MAG: ribosome silencing factor [Bacteroidota bacterium]